VARALNAVYVAVVNALAALAGLTFALTAILITVNVVLRAVHERSLFGLFDAIEYALMAATFLAAPWVLARNAHVTVDIALIALPPNARRRVAQAGNLFAAVLAATFFWFALEATLASFARGSTVRTSFVFPEWWALSVMPAAMFLMAIEFVLRYFRGVGPDRMGAGL
jgi:TRAP-type C4-dicarboxylate transport system permease small subunit